MKRIIISALSLQAECGAAICVPKIILSVCYYFRDFRAFCVLKIFSPRAIISALSALSACLKLFSLRA